MKIADVFIPKTAPRLEDRTLANISIRTSPHDFAAVLVVGIRPPPPHKSTKFPNKKELQKSKAEVRADCIKTAGSI